MNKKTILISSLSVASFCQISNGAALLVDIFSGQDPTNSSAWSDAGVVEDLSDAAAGTVNGAVFNITSLTSDISGEGGTFNGNAYPNPMLTDYLFTSGTITVSLGGFETGGVANTMTSSLGDLTGNTFTLEADTSYRLYLFGSGDADGQDSMFTFDGVSKTTSPVIVGSAEDADHFVTYDFTTGADLTGFTLDFTVDTFEGNPAAFNGLALVSAPVPEPSTSLLLFGVVLAGMTTRRRK